MSTVELQKRLRKLYNLRSTDTSTKQEYYTARIAYIEKELAKRSTTTRKLDTQN